MKQWRHYVLVVVFLGAMSALVARAGYLAVTERDFLQEQGQARAERMAEIPANRGIIFDRNGEALAVSTPVFTVWMDPQIDKLTADEVARLARTLETSVDVLAARIKRGRSGRFVYLARRITPNVAQAVRDLGIASVRFKSEYQRFYPHGAVTAHIVGMTDVDDGGQEGVELAMDSGLRGRPGSKRVLRDRLGQTVKDLDYLAAPDFGDDVELSIDLRLQFQAYSELQAAVEYHGAASGSLVAVDVDTGEVLALVNGPSYNPNDTDDRDFAAMRNRVITDIYEPGSTLKPFAVLAALETGRYTTRTEIDTSPGYVMVGRKLVKDRVDKGRLTLGGIIAESSQVGIAKVALDLGERDVYDVLARAGIGELPGTGLPGETSGALSDRDLDKPIARATLAYGYGVTVSPLQLAQGYLTLATGGVRRQLGVIRGLPQPTDRRVFDEADVRAVIRMMQGVTTEDGTAPKARVNGFAVAGKTGTARKAIVGGYDDTRHVAFFAGMAPVDDPKVVVVVVIDEPKGEFIGGGEVAAPVFSRVVSRSLRLMGIAPRTDRRADAA